MGGRWAGVVPLAGWGYKLAKFTLGRHGGGFAAVERIVQLL